MNEAVHIEVVGDLKAFSNLNVGDGAYVLFTPNVGSDAVAVWRVQGQAFIPCQVGQA